MWTTISRRPFARAVALVAVCVLLGACDGGGHARNTPPTASFTTSVTSGVAALRVVMDASASSDREGPIAAYSWDFGDGSGTATGVTAVHLYRSAGNFAVTLTVTDRKGATASASRTITVAPNTPPKASFTVTPSSGRAPLTVTFNASASNDPDGTIVRYEWWFGDGVGFDGMDAERQHTYLFSGRFVVTLKVTDDRDGIGTSSALVIVTSDTAANWYQSSKFRQVAMRASPPPASTTWEWWRVTTTTQQMAPTRPCTLSCSMVGVRSTSAPWVARRLTPGT